MKNIDNVNRIYYNKNIKYCKNGVSDMFEWVDCRYMVKDEFQKGSGKLPKNSLFYITKGKISYSMCGINETAGADEFVSFPADTYFEREILEEIEFYYARFENPQKVEVPIGKISVKDRSRLLSTLNYMCNLQLMPEENAELKRYYLNDIFVQLEAGKLLTNTEKDEVVKKASEFFRHNLDKKISLEETADEIGVSVSGLIGHFKNITGMTPVRYLTTMRIKKAENLLCHTNSSIMQIASECGFDNAYYFCNTFKKYNGIAPTIYRKKYGV